MRITTYQKKMEAALKLRPRFESENLNATVTLTGADNMPMIDMQAGDDIVSVDLEEAKLFASWIKQVAR